MPRTMLHFNNIFWMGGVPMFIKDVIASYPEFYHVIGYIWDNCGFAPHPDYDMMQEWESIYGCRIGHTPLITPEIIEEVDPSIVMYHNTGYKYMLKTDIGWEWIRRWPSINFHHMNSDIISQADQHVCVSEETVRRYNAERQKALGQYVICPPVVDTEAYSKIVRPKRDSLVIGKVSSAWNPKKYPDQLLRVMQTVGELHQNVSFSVVGGAKHWKNPNVRNLTMPEEKSKPVPAMMADLDIFLYINHPSLPESWGRTVTEAMASGLPVVAERRGGILEQIEDGVDGFLCETDEEFVKRLRDLVNDADLRASMGQKAKEKAMREFGFSRLHRELDSLILRGVATAA